MRVRFELGATTDYTNELFYEDSFDSNAVSVGRSLIDTPEAVYGGVLFAQLEGTRARRGISYRLLNEAHYGDLLKRDVASFYLRSQLSPDWVLQFTPNAEYRRDRTFDRDLEEWRGHAGVRARRAMEVSSSFAEFSASGDVLRARGRGSEFVLDRDAVRAGAAFEHAPLWGPGWRLGYALTTRVFPDSSERDHFEHGLEGQLRFNLSGGTPLTFEAEAQRRSTVKADTISRDNFWEWRGAGEGGLPLGDVLSLRARIEGEALHYDRQDSTLYFDYQLVRARAGPRFAPGGPWNVAVGPRGEVLFSRLSPGEGYQELAAALEVEYLGRSGWWNIAPAAGWRDYDELPGGDADGLGAIHSSYAYVEVGVFGDQTLPAGLKLRAFANARFESHIDSAQDARSLYFSLDLRRLF